MIKLSNISKSYGEKLLINDLSFSLPAGGIVGVIGANGAGKSTLFRMIIGTEKPNNGSIEIGETVKLSYVDQSRDTLKDERSVWEEISSGNDIIRLGDAEVNSRGYCSSFNFKGSDQQKMIRSLSGGERNKGAPC